MAQRPLDPKLKTVRLGWSGSPFVPGGVRAGVDCLASDPFCNRPQRLAGDHHVPGGCPLTSASRQQDSPSSPPDSINTASIQRTRRSASRPADVRHHPTGHASSPPSGARPRQHKPWVSTPTPTIVQASCERALTDPCRRLRRGRRRGGGPVLLVGRVSRV